MKIVAMFLCLLSVMFGLFAMVAGTLLMVFPLNDRGELTVLFFGLLGTLLFSDAALIQLLVKRLDNH